MYRDSVLLMRLAQDLRAREGVHQAEVLMATPNNLRALQEAMLLPAEVLEARPGRDDLVVVLEGEGTEVDLALREALAVLDGERQLADARVGTTRHIVRSLDAALPILPGANLALLSIPGPYVRDEAMAALRRGLNVFIFSSNVPVEDEVALKQEAARRGLLVMGPDCGTALLAGTAVGFANSVRRGTIGLVGASGTGLQEVSVLVHRAGLGVSHAIGTGSRDIGLQVGGQTMGAGLDLLNTDPATRVVVLVTKPLHPDTARRVLQRVEALTKPAIVCLLGFAGDAPVDRHVVLVRTLEDAAIHAVSKADGRSPETVQRAIHGTDSSIGHSIERERRRLRPGQRWVRGLYAGGTLAAEAAVVWKTELGAIWANFNTPGGRRLSEARTSIEHSAIDLGDEVFTAGRPHPMLEPRMRAARILQEAVDPSVAAIALDFVLGHVAHPDPVGVTIPTLREARAAAARAGHSVPIVATVCGTEADPQRRTEQVHKLSEAGVIVAPTNAEAARIAALIARGSP
jgi:FdrA protein